MTTTPSFDPAWERDVYARGEQLNRYPYDFVVTFVYRNLPPHKRPEDVRILEVGCGAGNNLWFAAREGFQVAGVDGSPSAIGYAQRRFAEDGLAGDLRVGDFTSLPFPDADFDLALDRGALTSCGLTAARRAVHEIKRVLRPRGRFLFNPYSDRHSSYAAGWPGPDNLTTDITSGLRGVGPVRFDGRRDVEGFFDEGWKLLSLEHLELVEMLGHQQTTHAEWRVIAERLA